VTAETITTSSPWPLAEKTLAANPALRYLWDGSPVRAATEAEADEYARRLTSPEWQRVYCHAPGYVAPVIAEGLPPATEPDEVAAEEPDARAIAIAHAGALALVVAAAADESAGLVLTEDGHDDPSAAAEGAAADPDEPSVRDIAIATVGALGSVVAAELDAGREAAMERFNEAHDAEATPAETAVIPAVEDFTQAIPAVTDSTEGDGQA
jgi:hypothetical protein